MGIRFRCHQCGHELHVKDFQGGKRSKCPECEIKFRIPSESAEYSIPLDASQRNDSTATSKSQGSSIGIAMETLPAKSTLAKPSSPPSSPQSEPEGGAENDAPQEIDFVSYPAAIESAQPQAILDAPDATWYVRPPAGGQYGPAPANIFCEWLTEHRVTRDSLVWRDGWPQWLVAGEVFTDYFGPAVPPHGESKFVPGPAPAVAPSAQDASPTIEQPTAPDFVVPTSLSDRALAARKRQRKKNYMIMIGILTAISIGLVISLVAVLVRNS